MCNIPAQKGPEFNSIHLPSQAVCFESRDRERGGEEDTESEEDREGRRTKEEQDPIERRESKQKIF